MNYLRRLLLWVAASVSIIVVFIMFIKEPGIEGYHTVGVDDMIYGHAHKPFVTRALAPLTVRALCQLTPENIRLNLVEFVKRDTCLSNAFTRLTYKLENAPEYLFLYVVMFISLMGYYFVLMKLGYHFLSAKAEIGHLAALAGIWMLPVGFRIHSHIYDFSQLFLFAACLLFLSKAHWKYYLPAFFITCINKETSILLVMIFIIHYGIRKKLPKKSLLILLGVQILIYIVVRGALAIIYENNPGSIVEFHLAHNIGLIRPYSFEFVIAAAVLLFVVFNRWKQKPEFLRDSLWIALPLIILTSFFGLLEEIRDYYELFPIILLLAANTIKLLNRNY